MKKNNSISRLIVLVLLVTIVTLILVSGTYSKYTSQTAGNDTVTVAKWAITVNDKDITTGDTPGTITFDLFNTINEADTTTAETDVDGTSNGSLIAPGTGGSFALEVKNLSEVTAEYKIAFTETNANNVPIEYSLDKTTWVKANEGNVVLPISSTAQKLTTKTAGEATSKATTTVYWRWAFTGSASSNYTSAQTDTSDTLLGVTAATGTAPTVKLAATITVDQVD